MTFVNFLDQLAVIYAFFQSFIPPLGVDAHTRAHRLRGNSEPCGRYGQSREPQSTLTDPILHESRTHSTPLFHGHICMAQPSWQTKQLSTPRYACRDLLNLQSPSFEDLTWNLDYCLAIYHWNVDVQAQIHHSHWRSALSSIFNEAPDREWCRENRKAMSDTN